MSAGFRCGLELEIDLSENSGEGMDVSGDIMSERLFE